MNFGLLAMAADVGIPPFQIFITSSSSVVNLERRAGGFNA